MFVGSTVQCGLGRYPSLWSPSRKEGCLNVFSSKQVWNHCLQMFWVAFVNVKSFVRSLGISSPRWGILGALSWMTFVDEKWFQIYHSNDHAFISAYMHLASKTPWRSIWGYVFAKWKGGIEYAKWECLRWWKISHIQTHPWYTLRVEWSEEKKFMS